MGNIYKQPIICLDFDDTLVENRWPGWGAWLPGAVEAVHTMHEAGARVVVASTRLHPCSFYDWPIRVKRPLADVKRDEQLMREFLDDSGLTFVEVYNEQGKCPADVYVDDKAVWYPGRTNSWKRLTPVILTKVGLKGEFE